MSSWRHHNGDEREPNAAWASAEMGADVMLGCLRKTMFVMMDLAPAPIENKVIMCGRQKMDRRDTRGTWKSIRGR